MKNRKGQSALEYLMTYGWALVVIVIVVAALVFLINPSQVGGSACTGFDKLPIGNFKFDDAANQLQFKVTNQTGRGLSQVSFGGNYVQGGVSAAFTSNPIGVIAANAEQTVPLTGSTISAGTITANLDVNYNDGDFNRTATGTCKGSA